MADEPIKDEVIEGDKTADKMMDKTAEPENKEPENKEPENKEPENKEPDPPQNYDDIALPEGSLLEAAELDKTVLLAKARGLSSEDAQLLLNEQSKLLDSYAGKQEEVVKTEQAKWVPAMQADAEIGGDAFAENAQVAKRVIDRYGSDELKAGLRTTGFGNNPELVRMMVRIGKSMSEDQLVLPGSKSPAEEKSMADVFYGGSNNDK